MFIELSPVEKRNIGAYKDNEKTNAIFEPSEHGGGATQHNLPKSVMSCTKIRACCPAEWSEGAVLIIVL